LKAKKQNLKVQKEATPPQGEELDFSESFTLCKFEGQETKTKNYKKRSYHRKAMS